ncbi:MAG TPA: N-6 DNA methylase [Candidatus Scatomonas merdigallinarum]|nr:N-6 DNA methylase [Candidatus Scatomonas merdigallinarum]
MLQTQKAIFFSSKKKRMTARLNCTERYLTSVPAGGVQNDIFHGFDMDRTMLRIGAMNMMTHGVENPFIEYRDSFSDQNSDREKYTLILANPPFKGSLDYDTVSADLLKICKTKKTELFKRAEVQDNDIPGILQRFKSREQEKERKRTEQSFMVDKKEIVENEYDLSINKYKEIEYVPVEYPPTEEIMADIYQPEKEIKKNLDELSEMLKKNNKFVSAIQNSLEKTQQLFNNLMQKYFG